MILFFTVCFTNQHISSNQNHTALRGTKPNIYQRPIHYRTLNMIIHTSFVFLNLSILPMRWDLRDWSHFVILPSSVSRIHFWWAMLGSLFLPFLHLRCTMFPMRRWYREYESQIVQWWSQIELKLSYPWNFEEWQWSFRRSVYLRKWPKS
jgi:hypothetical protein